MISDKERGKAWIVPDHVGWWRERAKGLHQLAQGHEQEQSEERANASAEEPASQKEQAEGVNQRGAHDEECVGRSGVASEVRVGSHGQAVECVADAGCRSGSRADQRLRPKPQREDNSGHEQAQEQAAPAAGVFGLGHKAFFIAKQRPTIRGACVASSPMLARVLAQIELSGAEIRETLDAQELVL